MSDLTRMIPFESLSGDTAVFNIVRAKSLASVSNPEDDLFVTETLYESRKGALIFHRHEVAQFDDELTRDTYVEQLPANAIDWLLKHRLEIPDVLADRVKELER